MKMSRYVIRTLFVFGLWLGVGLQAQAQTDKVTYVYTDPQGTPLVEADASGNVIARYDYTPYGNSVTSLGSPPDGPGYTGHVNDPKTGLVYMQARYYQPIGRFLSPDPVGPVSGNLFGFNRYAYANDNPVINTDPTGAFSDGMDEARRNGWDGWRNQTFWRDDRCAVCLQTNNGTSGSGKGSSITQVLNYNEPAPDSPVIRPEDAKPMAIMTAAAKAASDAVPLSVPQPRRGTLVHIVFAYLIRGAGLTKLGYTPEVSYVGREYVAYGTPGSVRGDAIFGNAARPQIVVDLKTGNARMTNGDVHKYYDNLPLGARLYQISVP